jgi:hypothetical protein
MFSDECTEEVARVARVELINRLLQTTEQLRAEIAKRDADSPCPICGARMLWSGEAMSLLCAYGHLEVREELVHDQHWRGNFAHEQQEERERLLGAIRDRDDLLRIARENMAEAKLRATQT